MIGQLGLKLSWLQRRESLLVQQGKAWEEETEAVVIMLNLALVTGIIGTEPQPLKSDSGSSRTWTRRRASPPCSHRRRLGDASPAAVHKVFDVKQASRSLRGVPSNISHQQLGASCLGRTRQHMLPLDPIYMRWLTASEIKRQRRLGRAARLRRALAVFARVVGSCEDRG